MVVKSGMSEREWRYAYMLAGILIGALAVWLHC
jgi:hypothetical protein